MKLLPGLVAAVALVAAPALAQEKAPIDPARLALAKKLVEASGGQKNAETMVSQIYGSMDQIFAKAMPPESQRVIQLMQRDMQAEMLKMIPSIMDASVEVYARNLTEKELSDMLAFQTSESGQSIIRKLPTITQDVLKAEIPYIQAMLPRIMKRVVDQACEEAKCTPAERQQVAQALAQMQAGKPS